MESKMQRYGAHLQSGRIPWKRGPGIPPFLGTARQASPNGPLARHLVDRRGPRVGMTRTVRLSDLAIRWFELCTAMGGNLGQSRLPRHPDSDCTSMLHPAIVVDSEASAGRFAAWSSALHSDLPDLV